MYVRLPDGIDNKTLKDLWILKLLTVGLESMIYAGKVYLSLPKSDDRHKIHPSVTINVASA